FTDRESLEQLSAIEDDLINNYLLSELSPQQREQFEKYLLTTPERAARLEFARDLLATIAAADAPLKPVSWWRSLLRSRNQALLLPVAVAVLLLLLIGY